MQKWEYKCIAKYSWNVGEDELNTLGEQGWELVTVVKAIRDSDLNDVFQFYLKRRVN